MEKVNFFIAYAYTCSNGNQGFRSTIYHYEGKDSTISSAEDINYIRTEIMKANPTYANITILNIQRMPI